MVKDVMPIVTRKGKKGIMIGRVFSPFDSKLVREAYELGLIKKRELKKYL